MTVPRRTRPKKPDNISDSERILWSEAISAKACSVSVGTFRNWVALGLIPRVSVPGNVRRNLYRRVDVEAFAAGLPASA